jgi:hypothetical protein
MAQTECQTSVNPNDKRAAPKGLEFGNFQGRISGRGPKCSQGTWWTPPRFTLANHVKMPVP